MLKATSAERLPGEVVAVFDRSIQDLLEQGVPAGALRVGDVLEPFALDDAKGAPVTLDQVADILAALAALADLRTHQA